MKKLTLILIILIFGISTNAQIPNLQWKKGPYTMNGYEDDIYSFFFNTDLSVFMTGKKLEITATKFSTLSKLNSNGDLLFVKTDDTNSTANANGCVLSNAIAYTFTTDTKTYLTFRAKDSGNFISKIQVLGYTNTAALSNWQDTLVCTFREGTGIYLYDNQGNFKRSFSAGFSLKGNVTTCIFGDNLWIFTNRYNPNLRGVVSKYNLTNGQLLWTREIDSTVKSFGDVDSLGNSYLTSSCIYTSGGSMYLRTKKFDSSGTLLWDEQSLVNKTPAANYGNYINCVGVNLRKGIVVIGCQVEKDSMFSTSRIAGYVLARRISDGDSVFAFKVYGDEAATMNFVQDLKFNSLNEMFLLVKTRETSWNPRNRFFISKYIIDTLTNINGNFNETSQDFSLSQNYPNPFNGMTNIKYQVSKNSWVNISIYNLIGQKVGQLVNERKSPGIYEERFDASEFPSGVYFYRLETNGFSDVKKMTLVK